MERQIQELETENSQLKSQVNTSIKTVVETAKPEVKSPVAPPAKPAGPAYATVRAGDTLAKVAKRNGTTSATLIKLNKLKNPSLIRPGQKLRLPEAAPAVAKSAPASSAHGTHIVKSGETFFSIARHYGLSTEALQAANPQIKPERLRAGQTLTLGAKPEAAAMPVSDTAPVAQKATAEPAPETAAEPVSNTPRLRLVTIDAPIDFGAFAAAHGTSTAKLNALNGHNLNPSTVLAKGSEFYVPAQP
jgi:LysM repeat protein